MYSYLNTMYQFKICFVLFLFVYFTRVQGQFGFPPPPQGQFGFPPPDGRPPPQHFGDPPPMWGPPPNGNGQFPFGPPLPNGNGQQPRQRGPPPDGNNQQFGGPMNGRGPRCRPDANSATLPECMNKYVSNGEAVDGTGNCQQKSTISSKTDAQTLLSKAEEIVRSGQCQGEMHPGEGGMGGGGLRRGDGGLPIFRQKRQGFPKCGQGLGVGNCDNDNQRLQSIYAEKDLGDSILIVTNGVPDHCYRQGMDQPISNYVCEHYRAALIPKTPRKTNTFNSHPMGIVGIAKSGAFFYNHLSAEQTCNVAAITEKATFDTCDGHPDPGCHYHYHKAPVCIAGFKSCGLIGYSNDGVPVYGKCALNYQGRTLTMKSCYKKISGKNGCDASHYVYDSKTAGCNLDKANGFLFDEASGQFSAGSYAYFFTPEYPFIMPGYYGDKSLVKWCIVNV